jgi:hypothetical protein
LAFWDVAFSFKESPAGADQAGIVEAELLVILARL